MTLSTTSSVKKPLIKLHVNSHKESCIQKPLEMIALSIVNGEVAYEDVAEEVEDKAYVLCKNGEVNEAIISLKKITDFFESFQNKNEEISRDLADVYLLVGQMFQFSNDFNESLIWFQKSILIDDQYAVSYHNLAVSYKNLKDYVSAVKCLEQEITLAPGNYYSYLLLSEIYEIQKKYDQVELSLKKLLARDPENIQAIHKLIQHYKRFNENADVSLLCRKIVSSAKIGNRSELLIKIYYLCKEKRFKDAIDILEVNAKKFSESCINHLVKVYIYGLQRKFILRKNELECIVKEYRENENYIKGRFEELALVFGKKNAQILMKNLFKKV